MRKQLDSVYPLELHLFVVAGSTQAAKEAVDHLNSTEQLLQTAGHHQSDEESSVELHHVLRLGALSP